MTRLLALTLLSIATLARADVPSIVVENGKFVEAGTKKPFTPWGFNYDRDHRMRLLEEYWEAEWATVESDLREMKSLGANVVRIHLQFHRFMAGPDRPNDANLKRLDALVRLAEDVGLHVNLTGLGCYRRKDSPAWYDAMDEPTRWKAQASFWEAVAKTLKDRPGVFCYDLANEPLVPGERRKPGSWIAEGELAGFSYLQFITLDPAGRQRPHVARDWIRILTAAIRKHDRRRLVTVGVAGLDLNDTPEEVAGFSPSVVIPELDFMSYHVYPGEKKMDMWLASLKRCDLGKPLVIEELFPIHCDAKTLGRFIDRSKEAGADGWIGFYWGKTPQELKASKELGDQLTLSWLELFQSMNPNR
jgi:hypothetical protein